MAPPPQPQPQPQPLPLLLLLALLVVAVATVTTTTTTVRASASGAQFDLAFTQNENVVRAAPTTFELGTVLRLYYRQGFTPPGGYDVVTYALWQATPTQRFVGVLAELQREQLAAEPCRKHLCYDLPLRFDSARFPATFSHATLRGATFFVRATFHPDAQLRVASSLPFTLRVPASARVAVHDASDVHAQVVTLGSSHRVFVEALNAATDAKFSLKMVNVDDQYDRQGESGGNDASRRPAPITLAADAALAPYANRAPFVFTVPTDTDLGAWRLDLKSERSSDSSLEFEVVDAPDLAVAVLAPRRAAAAAWTAGQRVDVRWRLTGLPTDGAQGAIAVALHRAGWLRGADADSVVVYRVLADIRASSVQIELPASLEEGQYYAEVLVNCRRGCDVNRVRATSETVPIAAAERGARVDAAGAMAVLDAAAGGAVPLRVWGFDAGATASAKLWSEATGAEVALDADAVALAPDGKVTLSVRAFASPPPQGQQYRLRLHVAGDGGAVLDAGGVAVRAPANADELCPAAADPGECALGATAACAVTLRCDADGTFSSTAGAFARAPGHALAVTGLSFEYYGDQCGAGAATMLRVWVRWRVPEFDGPTVTASGHELQRLHFVNIAAADAAATETSMVVLDDGPHYLRVAFLPAALTRVGERAALDVTGYVTFDRTDDGGRAAAPFNATVVATLRAQTANDPCRFVADNAQLYGASGGSTSRAAPRATATTAAAAAAAAAALAVVALLLSLVLQA